MGKWRKLPVEIEAVRFLRIERDKLPGEDRYQFNETMPRWLVDAFHAGTIEEDCRAGPLLIRTLEGVMECDRGDWIIRGVAGELYPCKPDIFQRTYERVS
jgi:hypothetical protein